jgi:pyridoxal phosphate enzyme (YggS family)
MTLPAPIEWHFIGPIQSNKTKLIAEHFDWVQSIDRQSIAERLSRQRPSALGRLNALIEVNLDGEASKSGVAPEGVASMAADIVSLPGLKLRGVMAIPQPSTDPIAQRERFDRLKSLADTLACLAPDIDTISMGMSGDYESAIAAGSTMVRIGTAIFGERS